MHRSGTGNAMAFPTVTVSRLALCEANCKKPVYTMHRWWARRLGVVFRMLLLAEGTRESLSLADRVSRFYSRHRLPDGFTVLDPFLGGGTSLIEAAKLGAHCIGVDIDPVACFVSEQELCRTDPDQILAGFNRIKKDIGNEVAGHYRSSVNRRIVDVIYYFWVDSITCPDCDSVTDGHPTFQICFSERDNCQTLLCPCCGHIDTINLSFKSWTCTDCGERNRVDDVPVARGMFTCPGCEGIHPLRELYTDGLVAPRMFAKEYLDKSGNRGIAAVDNADLRSFARTERLLKKHGSSLPLPESPIPRKGRSDARPLIFGYRQYSELFNDRQLYCLGLLGREIKKEPDVSVRKALALAFSHCLASNNMFCGYAFGYRRLAPLFSVHAYRKISRPVEGNVLGLKFGRGTFANCVQGVMEGCAYMRSPYELKYPRTRSRPQKISVVPEVGPVSSSVRILNRSSSDLSVVEDNSVDLILSDPPYFDNLPYSELSDFYHVWLREVLGKDYVGHGKAHTPLELSLFAGRRNGRCPESVTDVYTRTLARVFKECHRVAKDNARFIFTFHHRNAEAWKALGHALLASGFVVKRVFPVRSEGRSGLHSYTGTIKWDSVFICDKSTVGAKRKPKDADGGLWARNAWRESGEWKQRIQRSGLDFGWADRNSLAMSFVLRIASARQFHLTYFDSILSHVENRATRLEAKQLTPGLDNSGDDAHGEALS